MPYTAVAKLFSFFFFFKQKTAYEIGVRLVGSEMCIRDSTYSVYLSSKPLTENLEVNYQVIVGDGLKSGVDFELVTKGSTLTFLPGIYDMPIRIRWMPNHLDENKDNTITIRLTGNNQGLTMGLPGPDGLQRELVIEKQN